MREKESKKIRKCPSVVGGVVGQGATMAAPLSAAAPSRSQRRRSIRLQSSVNSQLSCGEAILSFQSKITTLNFLSPY